MQSNSRKCHLHAIEATQNASLAAVAALKGPLRMRQHAQATPANSVALNRLVIVGTAAPRYWSRQTRKDLVSHGIDGSSRGQMDRKAREISWIAVAHEQQHRRTKSMVRLEYRAARRRVNSLGRCSRAHSIVRDLSSQQDSDGTHHRGAAGSAKSSMSHERA